MGWSEIFFARVSVPGVRVGIVMAVDALRKEDKAAFQRLTTAFLYSFDVGKRFAEEKFGDAIPN